MNACPRLQQTAVRRAAVLVLLAAFVLAQALGWLHRAAHGDTGTARLAVTAQSTADSELHASAPLDSLFGSHADDSDCRLFDVLAHPGCATAAVAMVMLPAAAAFLLASHGDFVARWSALFDARGPPATR